MFTGKVIASLFLIATAGVLDAGRGLVGGDAGAMAASGPMAASVTTTLPADTGSASMGQVRAAVARALLARVRSDLDDDSVLVDVSGLSLRRDDPGLVSVDGQATVSLGAGGLLPVHVEADWNADARRVDRLDYRVTGAATAQAQAPGADVAAGVPARAAQVGTTLHAAIEGKVAAGIRAEFASQHPDFQLVAVDAVTSGRYRMVVAGTGITRFPGEGAAFTRFSASIDKFDGRVLRVDYELLQDMDARAVAAR